jgi:crotonobetainyl-CoA:carnitine CoA-transferase CaiB-like acyl-CoA transferase
VGDRSTDESNSSGPLIDLRVIDCSRGMAGPRAGGLLADYGADVIWVEPPGGDPYREALAPEYSVLNRGKRSVVLDLKEGVRDLYDLLKSADVFLHSWRPGVAERLGLDFDTLHQRFPNLVYCSISGFGSDGSRRDLPGHEAIVHALVGTMSQHSGQLGHRDGPIYEALPFASMGAGYLAVMGVLSALYRRLDDGVGRLVETSLFDGALAYHSLLWGETGEGQKRAESSVLPGFFRQVCRAFRCADDEYLGIHTGAHGAFSRLMTLLGFDDRIPPSETGMDLLAPLDPEQAAILMNELPGVFDQKPRSVWLSELLAADVCAIPILHQGEIFSEPQPVHNGMVIEVCDPALGPVTQVAPAAKFSRTPGAVRCPAPRVGEHTAEILNETGRMPSRWNRVGVQSPDMRPLLDGVRILDIGAYYAGPYSSRLLADLGADVIKLEPLAGDVLRNADGIFRSGQAGKRAIAVDLKRPEGQMVGRKLLEWADVIHHNMRPGAAERLGMGYEQALTANPTIIYMSSPGWGSSGPEMSRQSFAPLMTGYVGGCYEVGGRFNPPLFSPCNEDSGNGLVGAIAMLCALLHRRLDDEGQLIENPQLHAAMAHVSHLVRTPDGQVLGAGKLDELQLGFGALNRLYETADDWICVVAITDVHLDALGKATETETDISRVEAFWRQPLSAEADYALASALGDAFRKRTSAEWVKFLTEAGVPVAQPIMGNTNHTNMIDPENQRLGRVAECAHPQHDYVREIASLVRVGEAAALPHRLAPALGQHTDEILAALGYDSAAVAELRMAQVVR